MKFLQRFLATEAAGGIALMLAAALALLIANSPMNAAYQEWLRLPLALRAGEGEGAPAITMSLAHWVNDGLMALFFLLIGAEIKRELLIGELSERRKAALPLVGAMGGVAVPALIYALLNQGNAEALRGWAIPTATDIAFSLGVLSLLGRRVPASLKIFLMGVAVIDDLIAVLIIALFYTGELNATMLSAALFILVLLFVMNRLRVGKLSLYLAVGAALWACVLNSGVHATIAGVALGLLIPLSLQDRLERALHPWVAFGVVPLFALANAGVTLPAFSDGALAEPVPLGIAAGLFFGKQLGIFISCRMLVFFKLSQKPDGVSWSTFYAVCVLAGIGFTMSLFIGALAFGDGNPLMHETRLGVLIGSLCSAAFGYTVLAFTLRPGAAPKDS